MSLDKAIRFKKENREEYRKAKAFDTSCRNHGGCEYCTGNRLRSNRLRRIIADEQVDEYMRGIWDGEEEK
jgi:hypothetical protein